MMTGCNLSGGSLLPGGAGFCYATAESRDRPTVAAKYFEEAEESAMKIVRMAALFLGMAIASAVSIPAYAQSEVTREQAQAVLARVSQDVWHAQHSSTGYGRVQSLYTEGERAYFKGDYAEAIKKLKMADTIVRDMPNDFSGPIESELTTRGHAPPSAPPVAHTAP
jgi:hypothetical protein